MPDIVALTKAVDCPDTGATANHHSIVLYQVDKSNGKTLITLRSWAKAGAKRHITHVNVTLPEVPPAGDVEQWLYQRLMGLEAPANVLHGAVPVVAEPAAAPAEGEAA